MNNYNEPIIDLSCFKSENWSNLDDSIKIQKLQMLEDYMAQKQGRNSRTISTGEYLKINNNAGNNVNNRFFLGGLPTEHREHYKFSENELGAYVGNYKDETGEYLPNYLFINPKYLDNPYEAMETVIHEGRHAFQDDLVHGNASNNEGVNEETIELWAELGFGGVYFDLNDKSDIEYLLPDEVNYAPEYLAYRFQANENDANEYAATEMNSFFNVFYDDPAFQEYIQNANDKTESEQQSAECLWGTDYINDINYLTSQRFKENVLNKSLTEDNINPNDNDKGENNENQNVYIADFSPKGEKYQNDNFDILNSKQDTISDNNESKKENDLKDKFDTLNSDIGKPPQEDYIESSQKPNDNLDEKSNTYDRLNAQESFNDNTI